MYHSSYPLWINDLIAKLQIINSNESNDVAPLWSFCIYA